MSRLDEARKALETYRADEDLDILLRSEALYRAEAKRLRGWYDGCVQTEDDMIWVGGDEWGRWQNARAATEAFEREMGGGRG